jgi:hypothetical protein
MYEKTSCQNHVKFITDDYLQNIVYRKHYNCLQANLTKLQAYLQKQKLSKCQAN